jgi:hypothetical protein
VWWLVSQDEHNSRPVGPRGPLCWMVVVTATGIGHPAAYCTVREASWGRGGFYSKGYCRSISGNK